MVPSAGGGERCMIYNGVLYPYAVSAACFQQLNGDTSKTLAKQFIIDISA